MRTRNTRPVPDFSTAIAYTGEMASHRIPAHDWTGIPLIEQDGGQSNGGRSMIQASADL
jgi:hypothetical protein